MARSIHQGDFHVAGALTAVTLPDFPRANLVQEDLAKYHINVTDLRVHDAPQTALPGTSSSDDLGLYGTTFATDSMYVGTGDVKTLTVTRYARFQVRLPREYVAGQTVAIHMRAGMITTTADVSATLDVEAYLCSDEGISGVDLYTDAAQSINSTTFSDKTFTLTSTSLNPGDVIDVRIAIAVVDTATETAVDPCIADIALLADVK